LPLVRGQLERAPKTHAPGLRSFAAVIGAGKYQLALEFGQAVKHGQHQPAVRCGRVCPNDLKGFEASAGSRISGSGMSGIKFPGLGAYLIGGPGDRRGSLMRDAM
jgi:hypothetical protein